MFFLITPQKKNKSYTTGFTLVELMVTVGLMLLITGVVIVKYSSFNSTVILKNQAYELALDIRSAQVYGVSAGGTTNNYREAFGIYINLNTPNEYILFQDSGSSGILNRYDGVTEQVGETYGIDQRFAITDICTTVGGTRTCQNAEASVAFKRPNFDAQMWSTKDTSPDKMEIIIKPTNSTTISRTVVVYASGQISVQ